MASLGRELAWANMATEPTGARICWRTNSVISRDTSTSEMRDSAACRFSAWIWRLVMVFSSLFCRAPRSGADGVLGHDGVVQGLQGLLRWACWVEMLRPCAPEAAEEPTPRADAVALLIWM